MKTDPPSLSCIIFEQAVRKMVTENEALSAEEARRSLQNDAWQIEATGEANFSDACMVVAQRIL